MELFTIVGYRPFDFTDENTKKHIQGISLYTVHDSDDESVTGQVIEKFSISSPELWQQLKDLVGGSNNIVGSDVIFSFNRKGKVIGFSL